jgi:large subunit ribosomal protein L13Ae
MFKKEYVIDGKGHLLGRLASVIAKQILSGQKVVVVRCEKIMKSGSLFRNKLKFMEYLRKRLLTNPRRGFKHFRCPSRILYKTVRGMIPRKTTKGECAMERLKAFEGCPFPYDLKKRHVVPDALKVLHMQTHRKFCLLDNLAEEVGWKQQIVVRKLEEKRMDKNKRYYERKVKTDTLRKKAEGSETLKPINQMLQKLGY